MATLKGCCKSFFITLVTVSLVLGIVLYRPPIETATYYELTQINGIGEVKANLILEYIRTNEDIEVEELTLVKGIGDTLVERLKRDYR